MLDMALPDNSDSGNAAAAKFDEELIFAVLTSSALGATVSLLR